MIAQLRATPDDLMRVEGKAEIIGGRIVELPMYGMRPSEVATNIAMSLREYAKQKKRGKAFADGLGYIVPELSSTREAFCPDASYYDGPMIANSMKFISGPPTFAVEVRSESDYGPASDSAYAEKRADYFEAGTKVVWDVDPINETVMRYTSPADGGTEFRRGQLADAEPAVPGWRMSVDEVFAS